MIALTKELTEMLRKNRTIDWQKKETARATMRKMVKRLLKKHHYPPEDYDFAINTVISQCELWTDNSDAPYMESMTVLLDIVKRQNLLMLLRKNQVMGIKNNIGGIT